LHDGLPDNLGPLRENSGLSLGHESNASQSSNVNVQCTITPLQTSTLTFDFHPKTRVFEKWTCYYTCFESRDSRGRIAAPSLPGKEHPRWRHHDKRAGTRRRAGAPCAPQLSDDSVDVSGRGTSV
jgi:hypothetical protein